MSSELERMPRGNPEELAEFDTPSSISVGWELGELQQGAGIQEDAFDSIHHKYENYNQHKESYDRWRDVDDETGYTSSYSNRNRYKQAVKDNMYELDADGNVVPGAGHKMKIGQLFDMDAMQGYLLSIQNGYTDDTLETAYSDVTKEKSIKLGEQKEDASMWGVVPGLLASYIAKPETLFDFAGPSKVMGSTIMKGAGKAFAIEAGFASVGEMVREQGIREHMERADLEYTLWDSVENILIGAGLAGFVRGIGSATSDAVTLKKINQGITNKTDKEIFARFARRENYKLTEDSTRHLYLLDKTREDINAGRQADIADHTDIDINTKTDDAIEEVSLAEEVKATSNIAPEEIKHFEEAIDNPPPAKEATETDPYEGMATAKEAEETIAEVIDDPEIKAMFDEIEVEKKRLSPQAQMAKEAKADNQINMSQEEASQAVKNVFKSNDPDKAFKNLSTDEIDEMDRLFKEDQETQTIAKEVEEELNADTAGQGGTSVFMGFGPEVFGGTMNGLDYDDETGTFSFDPMRFMFGFLAGHVAKKIMKNPKLNAVAKKEAMAYAQRTYDRLSSNPKISAIIDLKDKVK